ncbi:hypothetical protein ACLMJK_001810 [Lecanora helva]
MSTATASSGDDEFKSRQQQPMLASQRNKASSDNTSTPTESNRRGGVTGYFPLGYKEGFQQWVIIMDWANVPAAKAEHAVMSYIPYLKQPPTHTQTGTSLPSETPTTASYSDKQSDKALAVKSNPEDPYGPRQWHSNLVKLGGKNRALNEFSVERTGEEIEQNLVMLHGYGAGLGFFYKNFEGLSRVKGWKVYALDLLGMGRSSRPPFKLSSKDKQTCVTEAENWFIDALEEWRIQRKIDRFTLLGHSLGGYMAVAYALKYPGHLNKLILASPVGVPEDPYAVNAEMPEPTDSTMANEFTQDQQEDIVDGSNPKISGAAKVGDNNNFLNARSKAQQESKANDKEPRRPEEAQALHTYAYTLFKQRGSGEYALAYILAPGAFARSPLIRRIQGVGRQYLQPDGSMTSSVESAARRRETGLPVVFMYGENDWMDVAGGFAAAEKLKDEKAKALKTASAEERAAENGSAKVQVIKNAGHHVYLDGWQEFNEVMREEMTDVSQHAKNA